jgi:hypothetical protein
METGPIMKITTMLIDTGIRNIIKPGKSSIKNGRSGSGNGLKNMISAINIAEAAAETTAMPRSAARNLAGAG